MGTPSFRNIRIRGAAFLLLFVLCSATCFAEPVLSPAPPETSNGVTAYRDMQYVPNGSQAEKLDLYLPAQPSARPLPVVVWIHGGGWQGGSKAGCASLYLVGQGYAAASVEYRFSQEALFPAQIQDCQAAIRWLRANSKTYNLDPKHIGVWGESAGGHLVALLGTSGGKHAFPPVGGNENQSDRVQAVCDDFGPADFNTVMAQAAADTTKNAYNFNHGDPYSSLIGVSLGSDRAKGDAVSPVHYVSRDNPPFLILHGTSDNLVPYAQSAELMAALRKARVDATLQTFPNAGHGGSVFKSQEVRQQLIKPFFDKYLRGTHGDVVVLPPDDVTVPPVRH